MAKNKSRLALRVKGEHADLRQEVGEIVKVATEKVAARDFNNWKTQLEQRLENFESHLQKHFEMEEHGGFMADVLAAAPEMAGKVKVIEMEHGQILSRVEELTAMLDRARNHNAPEMSDFATRLIELLDILHRHETAENELVQTAYLQEYGGQA